MTVFRIIEESGLSLTGTIHGLELMDPDVALWVLKRRIEAGMEWATVATKYGHRRVRLTGSKIETFAKEDRKWS